MSVVSAPRYPLTNIFNSQDWHNLDNNGISVGYLNTHYLKFNVSQASDQTFSAGIIVTDSIQLYNDLIIHNAGDFIQYSDSTQQLSAYTGASNLAGSYTATNMTVNNQGRITALSNGTPSPANLFPSASAVFANATTNLPDKVFDFTASTWSVGGTAATGDIVSFRMVINYYPYSAISVPQNIQTFAFNMDIIPGNLTGAINSGVYTGTNTTWLINNLAYGNQSFLYTDATKAPFGRFIWTYDQAMSTNPININWKTDGTRKLSLQVKLPSGMVSYSGGINCQMLNVRNQTGTGSFSTSGWDKNFTYTF